MDSRTRTFHLPLAADLTWGAGLTAVLVAGAGIGFELPTGFYGIAALLYLAIAVPVICYWQSGRDFGWANRATLLRATMVVLLVSLAPFISGLGNWLWLYGSLCLLALILDGVDGAIARATRSSTDFGARFDMELDALFILGLCVAVLALDKAGAWVLALGLMRYAFLGAGRWLDFINRPLPESFRRKTVCVWQVVTLMIAILPITSTAFATWTLATALVLLCYSFFTDIHWLYQTGRQP
ncbi:CDP-alcohol phosphatidyltransferase family protein [Marinobacter orientalis]|uniref:CDP-alcohol phosphatidyltransferase family protein n=1 Tax=Marinobacter orientalis TaxID=1928859 RepID=A0A7Y0WSI3_9GAMM|nr:CDP-alcohol phosphatidyltransferase family protein [Marinobacter orientalis]NMT63835.1 CDP-alcohol phosphatidyltransferase family protein [Marinobacter orientalis]TGX49937.1 CDP-alcohol phosphatidyltransferase family protein [Marinobacter orientalis]